MPTINVESIYNVLLSKILLVVYIRSVLMCFWFFLLQKALFSFHFISSFVICDNLFSFFIRDSQNFKFLHWASIFIRNLLVSTLHTLLQYVFTPSSHFKNLFCTSDPYLLVILICSVLGILIYFSVAVNAPYFASIEKFRGYKCVNL